MESPAFAPGAVVPTKYTCSGADVSPPLMWAEAPPGTRAFALVCDDPDAPAGVWDHWVAYDIPGVAVGLPEAVPAAAALPDGSKQGKNGWGTVGYRGPCPPRGKPHRYFFRLYALSQPLGLPAGATSAQVRDAAKGATLETAELMGTFARA
ncbi:MAG TPA: YbhB/YbcL family Raf kinase inhibitor-like protein [Candidatus Thermoplasmatota archaeon]